MLTALSDAELINSIRAKVADEKRITLEILTYLREVEKRRIHSARGFSSLFEFATQALGYSAGAAQRRIDAMRMINEIPEVANQIQSGALNLAVAARAQAFFRQEKKSENPLPLEKKQEILSQLEGKSTRECERVLAQLATNPESFLKPDSIRPITAQHSEVRFIAPQALLDEFEQIRALLSHQATSLTLAELMAEMARITLSQIDPARSAKAIRAAKATKESGDDPSVEKVAALPALEMTPALEITASVQPAIVKSRAIPRATRRIVLARDGYRCTYVDPESGRKCESQFQLELDHIQPFAKGGDHSIENTRTLCKKHNQWVAIQAYGRQKMAPFIGPKEVRSDCSR